MMLANGSSESGNNRENSMLTPTEFVIMNSSSTAEDGVISTVEDLETLPEVNPKHVSPHRISKFCKAYISNMYQ